MSDHKKKLRLTPLRTKYILAVLALVILCGGLWFRHWKVQPPTGYQTGPAQVGMQVQQTMRHGDLNRTYLLRLPKEYKADGSKYPLVVFLHGGGETSSAVDSLTKNTLLPLADQTHAILIYPDGYGRQWHDGNTVGSRSRANIDDVGFLSALVDKMTQEYQVNPTKVYFVGVSNGAMMVSRILCEKADTITAAVMVAGSIPEPIYDKCHPSRPVSTLMMSGTDDPIVPYQGGDITLIGNIKNGGRVVPAETALMHWAHAIGAGPDKLIQRDLPDTDTNDDTRVQRWSVENSGHEAVLYRIIGGGHTWPSGRQYLPVRIIGKTSQDIIASDVVWSFLISH